MDAVFRPEWRRRAGGTPAPTIISDTETETETDSPTDAATVAVASADVAALAPYNHPSPTPKTTTATRSTAQMIPTVMSLERMVFMSKTQ